MAGRETPGTIIIGRTVKYTERRQIAGRRLTDGVAVGVVIRRAVVAGAVCSGPYGVYSQCAGGSSVPFAVLDCYVCASSGLLSASSPPPIRRFDFFCFTCAFAKRVVRFLLGAVVLLIIHRSQYTLTRTNKNKFSRGCVL